jgi:C4-dicarboxylate transporter
MVSAIDVKEQHAKYENSSPTTMQAVNEAFYAVVDVFKRAGLATGMSDEAEELVAAIHHYYERSK